jgi:hypothetical protein
MSPVEKGYVAGIIDGEGMIGIYPKGNRPSISAIRLVVTSTHEKLPQRLVEITKLGYYKLCKRKKDGRRIPSWQWFCFGPESIKLLKQINRLLIIKREQAEIVLKFEEHLKLRKNPKAKMSEEILVFGRQCAKQIRALNSRQRNKRILLEMARLENDIWGQL